jgi:Domain of unknown function (DUF1707)
MGDAGIRISSAERDEAITTLGTHLTTGRLELAEYEERCGRAAAARTRGELEELFTDLPAPHPDLSSATAPDNLIQKAGQLVTPKIKKDVENTPLSDALGAVAGMSVFLGIPAAILLTTLAGQWWVFILIPVLVVVFGSASEAAKKPKT